MYHPASMRRAGPILILLIGVLALLIDFGPGLRIPDSAAADGWRPIETKLGLDLSGVALWPAVLGHLALLAWCIACLKRMRVNQVR